METMKKVSLRITEKSKARFDAINEKYPNAIQKDIFEYLLSLEDSKVATGAMMVEQKIKQWLFLGIDKEITMHNIRKAEYPLSNYPEGHAKYEKDGKEKALTVGLTTVRKVFALYESEINKHNAALTK